jgi:hypothetical protein
MLASVMPERVSHYEKTTLAADPSGNSVDRVVPP